MEYQIYTRSIRSPTMSRDTDVTSEQIISLLKYFRRNDLKNEMFSSHNSNGTTFLRLLFNKSQFSEMVLNTLMLVKSKGALELLICMLGPVNFFLMQSISVSHSYFA